MYKTPIACVIIILFIGIHHFTSFGNKHRASKWFSALLICTFFHLLFDIFTKYTVNHIDIVSAIVNRVAHIFFLGLMLAIFYIVYKYLETMIEETTGKRLDPHRFSLLFLIAAVLGVIFLPISYIKSPQGNYSYGPAAFMAYVAVAFYLVLTMHQLIRYRGCLPPKKRRVLYITLLCEITFSVYQCVVPSSLVSCIGIVLFNLGIYMTVESPDALLAEQLAYEKNRADSANEAKTIFLANMSHEIRTPITAILGMNELIIRETKETSIKQYAKEVDSAAKSLLGIINDILDITKIEEGKLNVILSTYSFLTEIKKVITMTSIQAKKKQLEFKVIIDENIPRKLKGDEIHLRQILINLLSNAVKYTPKGTVTLEITLLPSEMENKAKLFFSVKDTGIGIKEEDITKLYIPFERIEEKRNRNIKGTGLGMSITAQLLNLLSSELKIVSTYGEGSEFSFELYQEIVDAKPIGQLKDYLEHDAEAEYHHDFEAPEAKILVVDDNELNRTVFKGLLKATKIQIDEAENGKECLEMITQKAYDIIFLDHMMPELDGIETFQIMKGMDNYPSKNAPVVILTANAIVGAKEMYLKEGFHTFLEKPIDYILLENVIKELLNKALLCKPVTHAEIPALEASELPMVEGLDWKYARIHFRDEATMLDTVALFTNSIHFEALELETLFTDIDTEAGRNNYCTKVHSMKNSASTIGIIPLAGMSKILEDSARNNNISALKAMHPIFLEYWKSYHTKLAAFSTASCEGSQKAAVDFRQEINELLQQIQKSAKNMDIDDLDRLWLELNSYQFPEEQLPSIQEIHKAIVNFDVDFLQTVSL